MFNFLSESRIITDCADYADLGVLLILRYLRR